MFSNEGDMRIIKTKKMIPWLILLIEIILVTGWYFFGKQGYPQIQAMRSENKTLDERIAQSKNSIQLLEQQIADWQHYPFYKEQVAREQLQMMQPGDEIYYIG